MGGEQLIGRFLASSALTGVSIVMAPDGVGSGGIPRKSRPNRLVALEPRVLFDAAGAETFDDVADGVTATSAAAHSAHADLLAALLADEVALIETDTIIIPPANSIVFIDSSVADIDVIIADLGPDVEVHILSADLDGVSQIADVMWNRDNISSIHIISHGQAGSLNLGTTILTEASIAGSHADEMAIIRAALSDEADILIYGCNFGAGGPGAAAMQALANATGADIAASDDVTGAAALGGDWDLEVKTGDIQVYGFGPSAWMHSLDLTITNVGVTGATGLANAILGSGVALSSAVYSGGPLQTGTFVTGAGTTFGSNILTFTSGAVFSTGTAVSVAGPNSVGNLSVDSPGVDNDAQFNALAGNATYDGSFLTMTFTPAVPPGASIGDTGRMTMEIVFGSDEYNEFVYGGVNDTLAVIVNGVNKSIVPNGLSFGIDTINNAGVFNPAFGSPTLDPNPEHTAAGFESANPSLYINNAGYSTQMDGFTVTLPVTFDIIVGMPNTIKMGIADTADPLYDSWFFVKADSAQTVIVAEADSVVTPANVPATIQVTANDYDLQGDTLTITHILGQPVSVGSVVTLSSGVTVTVGTGGNLTVLGNGTTAVDDTFTYAITDGNGGTSTAFVAVTITVADAPPVAQNDSFTMNEEATLTGSLLANNGSGADNDPESGPLSITQVNGASFTVGVPIVLSNGTLTITNATTGTFTFVPNANYVGGQAFNYTLADQYGQTDTASVSITVNNVNDAPEGASATLAATEDTPFTFSAANFGFTDPNDSPANTLLSVIITTLPTTGTMTLGGSPILAGAIIPVASIGTLVWTPPSNGNGPGLSTFTFQVTDNGGTANGGVATDQSPNTITFNVSAVNDPPVLDLDGNNSSNTTGAGLGANFEFTYFENAAAAPIVDLADFILTDVDNQITEINIVLSSATGQIGDTLQFPSMMPGGITASVFPVATLTAAGSLTLNLTGTGSTTLADWQSVLAAITFLPSTNDVHNPNPADRHITVQASDASGANSNIATATIHVLPENDPPTLDMDVDNSTGNAGNAYIPYTENDSPVALHSGVLTTDLDDTNFESAQVVQVNAQTDDVIWINGVVAMSGSSGAIGPVSYTVSTNLGGQLVIDFTGTATLAQYTTVLQAISFSNSSDNPSTVMRDISFQVNDGTNTSATRHVYVDFTAINDPPVGSLIPQQNGLDSAALTALDTSVYFTDPDSPALSYALASGAPIWLSINSSTGVIIGTPPSNASTTTNGGTPGTWNVTVIASDGSLTDSESFSYVITNPLPVAQPDSLIATEGTALVGANVYSNNGSGADNDPDGDTFSVSRVGGSATNVGVATAGSAGGLFTIGSTGALTFNDNGDFEDLAVGESRDTTITYQITDSDGGAATTTVTITVNGSNDAPVVSGPLADESLTDGQAGFTIDGAVAFSDPDGDTLTYSLGPDAPGWLTINATTGEISTVGPVPANASMGTNLPSGPAGSYGLTVIATDPFGGTVSDTLAITVTNLPPIAENDVSTVGEDAAPISGNVISDPTTGDADTAPDGDALTVGAVNGNPALVGEPVEGSTGGTFVINSSGTWTFDPGLDFQNLASGESRETTIEYRVSDGQGGFDTATVTVTVTGSNDAPVSLGPIPPQNGVDGEPLTPISTAAAFNNPSGDPITYSATGLPDGVTINPTTGDITGTLEPDASEQGPYVVNVSATLPDGSTATIPVLITVANPAPAAEDDSVATALNTAVVIAPLGNDIDTDGDPLEVTSTTAPANGSIVINPDGTLTYTPNTGFAGTDTFTYTVDDGNGGTDTATVTVSVGVPNPDAPIVDTPLAPESGIDGQPIATIDVSDAFSDPNGNPLTFTAAGLPDGLSLDAVTGEITGTLPNDASVDGPYTVMITASDPDGNQTTTALVITVANPAPVAENDGAATAINTPVTLNVTGNDSDADGDDLAVTFNTTPANGTVIVNPDGSLTYTPNTGFTGADTFTYTVSDGQGGTDTATVDISVGVANPNVPTAVAASNQTGQDGSPITPVDISTLVTDPNGDDLIFTATGLPPGLVIDPDTGIISGTLDSDASVDGPYTVQVTAIDPDGNQVTVPVLFTIANPAPAAEDDLASTAPAVPVTIAVLGNDADADSDGLEVTAATPPANGTVVINEDGSITYTPNPGFSGTDTFSYTISDGQGGMSTATVTVSVGSATGLALEPAVETIEGTDGTPIAPLAIGSIFGDPDGDMLTFTVDESALPPGITFNEATGTFSGTPDNNASQGSSPGQTPGTYVVLVTADDGEGGTTTQYITFTFENLPPAAEDDTAAGGEDAPSVSGNALSNDQDTAPDSDPLHVSAVNGDPALVGQPVEGSTGGTFALNPDGSWIFNPGLDFQNLNDGETRQSTLTYSVSDGQGGISTATITVTVAGSDDAPVALGPIPPQNGVDGETIVPIAAGDAFDNPTNLPLAFSATGLPDGLSIDPSTGEITGTLESDASVQGPYVINVTAIGPTGETSTFPVVLNVSNPSPDANPDGAVTALNTPVVISPLANDSDPDGDDLTITATSNPVNGTVAINPDGTVTYTPDTGFIGTDTFTYTVSDGQGGSVTETVTVSVGVPNPDAPTGTAIPDESADDGETITPIATSAAFTDPNSDPLYFSATGLPPGLSIDPDTGEITGTLPPNASTNGPFTAQITAVDPDGNQITLPLVIVVNNPAPVANDDALATPVDTAVNFNPLGNDNDPDGDQLQITYTSAPANGTVSINSDGTLTYVPDTGFTGTDTFTYTVSDGEGGTDIATVTIAVGVPAPDVPTAAAVAPQSGVDGALVSINVETLGAVTDPNGDDLVYTAVGLPEGLNINPSTGEISGTLAHDASQNGPYMVQVFATDPDGNSVGIPFVLTVTNPAPAAAGDVVETPEDTAVIVGVMGNDSDPDNDPLSISATTPPTNGMITVNADGTITYTPNAGYLGPDSFTYTISDGNGGTSTATVSIDVGPVETLGVPPAIVPITGRDGTPITPVSVTAAFGDPDSTSALELSVDPTMLPPDITFDPDTGTFAGTPASNASQGATPGEPAGTYIVPVVATDEDGNSVTQYVTFIFTNPPPVALDDTATIGEDASTTSGNALANDDDTAPDSDPLHVASINGEADSIGQPVSGSTGGTFTVNSDGTWTFAPGLDFQNLNAGETRDTTVTYLASDGQGGTSEATITVTVTGSDDAPVALGPIPPQNGTDGAPITPIAAGDAFDNPTNLPLTFSAAGLPDGLSIDPGTGEISGTLDNDASVMGPYVIIVTATAPDGTTASIPVQLNVFNPAPVAEPDAVATAVDTPVLVLPLGNDSDPDSDDLLVSAVSTPANGTVSINPDGSLTYTPDTGFTGTDTFTYTVSDGQGGNATETVTVTVGASPDVPTATPLAPASGVDGETITPIAAGSAFTDPNSDPLTFTATGLPEGLSIDPDTGDITGTLPNDASVDGPYTVLITATDPDGNQVTTALTFNVSNPAPEASPDGVSTAANTPVTLNPLANDSDPDSDPLLVSFVSDPPNGTVTINADGTITYTPDTGFTGTDTFTYTVSDGQGGTDIETVTVSVGTPSPDVPTADDVEDQDAMDGEVVNIDVADLANVTDPNGDQLTYSATGLPDGLMIDPDTGAITGTLEPDASQFGPYTIMVTAVDPDGNQVTIPVVLNVGNPAPAAEDDVVETPEDTSVIIGVLGNDTDEDGDPLAISATTPPSNGTITVNQDGTITYTPNEAYVGPDSFTYTVSDGNGGNSTATVTLDVGPVDVLGPPAAVDPINTTDGAVLPPFSVTEAFGDPDTTGSLELSVDPAMLPPGIIFDPDTGTFSGTAENDASQGSTPGEPPGTYIVPVVATDENDNTVTQYITFIFANPPPIAVADVVTDDEDAVQSGNVITDLVTGDADTAPDSDPLAVTDVNGSPVTPTTPAAIVLTHGTLVLSSSGAWTFTPNATANSLAEGEDEIETVTYTITDGNGGTDSATLEITIEGTNDAPFGVGEVADQRDYEGEEIEIDVSGFFDDVDTTDVLTYSASGLPPGLSIDAETGIISGAPELGSASNEPYIVEITVDDDNGGSFTMTFEWRIDSSAAPPVPPGGPPPSYPPLVTAGLPQDTRLVIGETVNGLMDLNGTPMLEKYVVTTAVEGLASLNSATDLGDGNDVISRLVAWAGRQGRSASWMHEIMESLDNVPYGGDSIDLALTIGTSEVLAIRTLLHNGALFIGIDELAAGVEVLSVSAPGGSALPDHIALIDQQSLIVNVRPDRRWIELEITARDASGLVTTWHVMINQQTAEVLPSTGVNDQIANVINSIRNRIASTNWPNGPSSGVPLDGAG